MWHFCFLLMLNIAPGASIPPTAMTQPFPSLPHPFPFVPCLSFPFSPFPTLPSPIPFSCPPFSSFLPSLPLQVSPLNPAIEVLVERCKPPPPEGSWAEPQTKPNLVYFSFKIWHPVATISMIFLNINSPNFMRFKQYQGKLGPRVILFKARFFWVFTITV